MRQPHDGWLEWAMDILVAALLVTILVGSIIALWSCPGVAEAERPVGFPPPEEFEGGSDYWLIASWPGREQRYRLWVHPAPAPNTKVTIMLCDGPDCVQAPVPSELGAWIGWQLLNVMAEGDVGCERYCPP